MSLPAAPGAKATRREWTGLAVLAVPCLLYSMDLTVLNLAVPQLSAELRPSASQLLWIMDIYGFLIAGLLITMGTLGDRIGRRRLLLIGAAAFGASSVLAAYAGTAEQLILARAIQGMAGATLAPSTLSLIRTMFNDEKERGFAIGVWVAGFSAGGAIGPLVGGVILEHFHWGMVFLINVPVMGLLLLLGPTLLPEYRDPDAGRLDLPSALLSIAAVLTVIYGVKHVAEHGPTLLSAGVMLAGALIGFIFVRRQQRIASPMIDVGLFTTPLFSAALAVNMLALFTAFGFFMLLAQYLQLVQGMGPFEAGLWTMPSGLIFIAGSMLGPLLTQRYSVAQILATGFALTAIGFALITQLQGEHGFAFFMAGFLLFCTGLSPIGALTSHLVVSAAPPERAGAASAISETSFELGGALGVAVLGSIVTAAYRLHMSQNLPAGLEASAARTAQDSLGGASAVAAQLGGSSGDSLMLVASQSFSSAMVLSASICIAIAIITTGITLRYLRQPPAINSIDTHGELP